MWQTSLAERKHVRVPCASATVAATRICILLHIFWSFGGVYCCCFSFSFSFFFFCCRPKYSLQGKETNNTAEDRYLHWHPLLVIWVLTFTWTRLHCKCTEQRKPVSSWPLDLFIQLLLLHSRCQKSSQPFWVSSPTQFVWEGRILLLL